MATQDNRVATFVERNKKYAETHTPAPAWSDFRKLINPAGAIVIVSCFDARANPAAYFGLEPGDAVIMANGGGRVDAGALRSIEVLDALAAEKGGVSNVVVAHHTDCGLTNIKDDEIRAMLKERAPEKTGEIDGMKFGQITDLRQSVIDDMDVLKASPYLRKDLKIFGFVVDIKTGTLEEVKQ